MSRSTKKNLPPLEYQNDRERHVISDHVSSMSRVFPIYNQIETLRLGNKMFFTSLTALLIKIWILVLYTTLFPVGIYMQSLPPQKYNYLLLLHVLRLLALNSTEKG